MNENIGSKGMGRDFRRSLIISRKKKLKLQRQRNRLSEEKLKQLFLSLGNKVQIISKENKSLYHAAAVTVSNFILGLVNNSLTYLKDCGFSEEIAMEALYPLIEFNLKNIKENGIMESLTGPVERGDLETITSHCKVLNQRDKKMYKLLSENILSIAEMKNKQRNYEKIREYLKR